MHAPAARSDKLGHQINIMGDEKQIYLNIKGQQQHSFDAIVVGSGISGGWAAKELCEKGLKTLVLERGRNVVHIKDYNTAFLSSWQFPHRLMNTVEERKESPINAGAFDAGSKAFYVSDKEHPYIQADPFVWIRGYQVGGRSLTWGRQCYRLSDLDFEANLRDGHAVDWPIRYRDIAPWYDYVEEFAGISGRPEGLAQLPDGEFLPPMEMNCIEEHFSKTVRNNFAGRVVTPARVANLTRGWKGRGPCQYRNLCERGCPFTGYFSSNGATLPAAAATGNLSVVFDAVVVEVLYDDRQQKAVGVRVMDAHTHQITEYFAKIIFLNASTINTAALLLRSVSSRFPEGLANDSGQVGHNLMDHFMGPGSHGDHDGMPGSYYYGRKPAGIYVPRFRNVGPDSARKDYVRGFGYQGKGYRTDWADVAWESDAFGESLKEQLLRPGRWRLELGTWGETLPYFDNRISLDGNEKDQWGLPLVKIHFSYFENEKVMRVDAKNAAAEMLESAGFINVEKTDYSMPGGSAIHEMGTVRMGRDPKTSVLNGFNQTHAIKNIFITDGSCMTSSACQNPSLTYMALTARACDFAVSEMKKNNI
jgi:choline dehydrogenase-like flavoprotein